jgi:hypothetical protein
MAIDGEAGPAPDGAFDGPLVVLIGEDGALPDALAGAAEGRVGAGSRSSPVRPSLGAEAAVVLFEAARRRHAGGGRPAVGDE